MDNEQKIATATAEPTACQEATEPTKARRATTKANNAPAAQDASSDLSSVAVMDQESEAATQVTTPKQRAPRKVVAIVDAVKENAQKEPDAPIAAPSEAEPKAVVEEIEQESDEDLQEMAKQEASKALQKMAKHKQEVSEELPADLESLLKILAQDIQQMPLTQLKGRIEAIKILFYKIVRAKDEAKREEFIAQGGVEADYKPEISAEETRLKELLNIYRTRRDTALQATEEQKAANYTAKLALVEELRALVDSTETMGQTFAAFRDIQSRWKEIGIVPLAVTRDLWDTYHHHTENFYNFIKINKELRDLDLKRNYEAKKELCERAEALLENPSATSAFGELQKLHDQYREAGPVALEFKEQLWDRFKAASARINKRHQEYYDALRVEQEQNLALKDGLCVKIEEFSALPLTSVAEWNSVQEQITELQKMWKTIGFAPKKDNVRVYERFRAACDKFFAAKRAFFGSLRSEMDGHLQVKTDLCVMAESLMESQDWKTTTDAIIALQKKWKESGPVARRYSDAIWKRFRSACDKFFEHKAEHFKESDSLYNENLAAKLAIIEELKAMQTAENVTFDTLKEIMGRFTAIGFVPIKQKESVAKQYKEVVDCLFERLRGAQGAGRIERYKERVGQMRQGGSPSASGRMSSEREKLFHKMKSLQSEIATLENNIGFFAKSKNAGSLVESVERKIEKIKAEVAEVIEKINLLDSQN
ncbi:MAG: DUF349 domain-containing protein [Mucinivorans sp.]